MSETSTSTTSPIPENYKIEILPEDQTNFDLNFKLIIIGFNASR